MPRRSISPQCHWPRRFLRWRKSWALWEKWVVAMAIAELIGLAIVLLASTLMNSLGINPAITVVHLVGVLQGVVLGVAQWLVLHRYIKHIGAWIIVTTIAALLAWLVGLQISALMAVSTTLDITLSPDRQAHTLLLGVLLLGAWVGSILGCAQWLVLKAHIRRASLWIVANALAWALGLGVAFTLMGRIQTDRVNLETVWTGAATGLATGAVIGAITGIALVWLLKSRLRQRENAGDDR